MSTAMRLSSAWSEAWRNLTGGAARLVPVALALALLGTCMAVLDTWCGADVLAQAKAYRDAGANVLVLSAPGGVDAASCERLGGLRGVEAAGAVREESALTPAALPDSTVSHYAVTSGIAAILDARHGRSVSGVMLADGLADTLGLAAGDRLSLRDGTDVTVASVYRYPDDGRTPGYAYALMEQVPASGVFDACWVQIWPRNEQVENAIWSALTPDAKTDGESSITVGQLNATLGRTYDGLTAYRRRVTRLLPVAGALAAFALGALAVRLRRLELASALHCGVPRSALLAQIGMESVWTITVALSLGMPIVIIANRLLVNLPDRAALLANALQPPATVSGAYLLGALACALLVRERHLFSYFKER